MRGKASGLYSNIFRDLIFGDSMKFEVTLENTHVKQKLKVIVEQSGSGSGSGNGKMAWDSIMSLQL